MKTKSLLEEFIIKHMQPFDKKGEYLVSLPISRILNSPTLQIDFKSQNILTENDFARILMLIFKNSKLFSLFWNFTSLVNFLPNSNFIFSFTAIFDNINNFKEIKVEKNINNFYSFDSLYNNGNKNTEINLNYEINLAKGVADFLDSLILKIIINNLEKYGLKIQEIPINRKIPNAELEEIKVHSKMDLKHKPWYSLIYLVDPQYMNKIKKDNKKIIQRKLEFTDVIIHKVDNFKIVVVPNLKKQTNAKIISIEDKNIWTFVKQVGFKGFFIDADIISKEDIFYML
ncbi:hypothetical protein [Spiroplasma endosymbiont of Labia minor]|uniref:hypothetical protein n=1 Tax=Spiroplasma endosymbiont of Labia minor TaxID=3066305 RepID=UPI0030CE9EEC